MTCTHYVKTWPEFFMAVASGQKCHEVRTDDRDYRTGDLIVLQEWSCTTGYTGRRVVRKITYKTLGGTFGLPPDLCVLSLGTVTIQEEVDATSLL